MRAAVYEGVGRIVVRDLPRPEVPDGWALLAVSHVGICGTDLAIVGGLHPRASPPLVMGHEVSATVVDVRAGGSVPRAGETVALEPLQSCGRCHACTTGNAHVCSTLRLFGIDLPGGMAEHMAVPTDRLHPVPPSLALDEAALIEPLAVAVHAVERSSVHPGLRLVVYGAGPVGLLIALVLRARGVEEIIVVEAHERRLGLARELGFLALDANDRPIEAIRDRTGGIGADVVFDAAGHPSVAERIVAACRVLGEIVLVGIYKRPTALDLQGVAFKEITLLGSRVYTPGDFRAAIELGAGGLVTLRPLISHVLPLEDAARGFEIAAAGSDALKVLFRVAAHAA